MDLYQPIVAYLGPETMLPVTSIVAGAAGIIMMFGRNAWRLTTRWLRIDGRRTATPRPKGAKPVSIRGLSRRIGEPSRPSTDH